VKRRSSVVCGTHLRRASVRQLKPQASELDTTGRQKTVDRRQNTEGQKKKEKISESACVKTTAREAAGRNNAFGVLSCNILANY
jgi:hypothetical protein